MTDKLGPETGLIDLLRWHRQAVGRQESLTVFKVGREKLVDMCLFLDSRGLPPDLSKLGLPGKEGVDVVPLLSRVRAYNMGWVARCVTPYLTIAYGGIALVAREECSCFQVDLS